MTSFSQKEIEFLQEIEECRVATSHDDMPHVKPVSYIYENDTILIATDYDTRMYNMSGLWGWNYKTVIKPLGNR